MSASLQSLPPSIQSTMHSSGVRAATRSPEGNSGPASAAPAEPNAGAVCTAINPATALTAFVALTTVFRASNGD